MSVWKRSRTNIFKNFNSFYIFESFWCANLKNNFLKIKNIILIHFDPKNTLKSNRNHTSKHTIKFPQIKSLFSGIFKLFIYIIYIKLMLQHLIIKQTFIFNHCNSNIHKTIAIVVTTKLKSIYNTIERNKKN